MCFTTKIDWQLWIFAPMSIKGTSQVQKRTWRSTMIWTSCSLFYEIAKKTVHMDRRKPQVSLAALLLALLTLCWLHEWMGRLAACWLTHHEHVKLGEKHLISHLTFMCLTKPSSYHKWGVREGRHFSWTPEGELTDRSLMN